MAKESLNNQLVRDGNEDKNYGVGWNPALEVQYVESSKNVTLQSYIKVFLNINYLTYKLISTCHGPSTLIV